MLKFFILQTSFFFREFVFVDLYLAILHTVQICGCRIALDADTDEAWFEISVINKSRQL